ncbi:hypothetical protein [Oleidesulfovibrio alaskensis]
MQHTQSDTNKRSAVDFLVLPAIMAVLTAEHFSMYLSGYMLHLLPQALIALTIGYAWRRPATSVARLFAVVIGSMLAVAALEVTFNLYKRVPFDERGPLTATSIMLLAACGITAAKIYRRRMAKERFSITSDKLIWLLMAVGFAFLTVDEKTLIHEGVDRMIYRGSGMQHSAFTERIDDFIVLGYAFIGMFSLYWYRREILHFKKTITVLAAGFVVMVIHSGLDMAGRPDFVINVLHITENATQIAHGIDMAEEILKLTAETCFLSGLMLALKDCTTAARK